jgi:hypothetical protein
MPEECNALYTVDLETGLSNVVFMIFEAFCADSFAPMSLVVQIELHPGFFKIFGRPNSLQGRFGSY